MLIDKKEIQNHTDDAILFADGVNFINTSQWILAYPIFEYLDQQAKDKSVPLCYNIALCYTQAKQYPEAIAALESALNKIKVSSIVSNPINPLPANLWLNEYDSNHYLSGLNETAMAFNINLIRVRIRRLLVDLHLTLENWQEVIRLSSLPDMDKCKNVQEASIVAKSKINS
ncbi:hypothetical protein [Pedobacter ureilyticus]|jgi:tetratricopeptide (TPR) repeat protein|uniref:Tetratricopeptide repeat protein n=1 Tax=Pedobacter ureilyticus TaxID=1393051 RepID=A0ABW9J1I0_9SPHI|nr:hypothetical protein [Pedobacter helvus]